MLPQHLSAKALAGSYLEAVPKAAGTALAGAAYWLKPELWPGPVALLGIGPLIALTLVEPLWRWCFTRVEISDSHFVLTRGAVHRREAAVPWAEIVAVDVRQSWAFRLCGVYSMKLAQGGDERTKMELHGVDEPLRAHIIGLANRAAKESPCPVSPPSAPPLFDQIAGHDSGDVLYRARLSHLLAASLVYGQFALIGAAVVVGVWDFLDLIGLEAAAEKYARAHPVAFPATIGTAIVLIGFAATVVRYAGFEVRLAADGRVTTSHGLFATHTRTVSPQAIVGVVLRRNFIEMALGRIRLVLITKDSRVQLGGNLVLPPLPRAVVANLMRLGFSSTTPTRVLAETAAIRSLARGLALLALTIAVAGAAWSGGRTAGAPHWAALILAAVALIVASALGRLLCSRLVYDSTLGLAVLTTRYIGDGQIVLDDSALHAIRVLAAGKRGLIVTAYYYAGTTKALRALLAPTSDVEALRESCVAKAPARVRTD